MRSSYAIRYGSASIFVLLFIVLAPIISSKVEDVHAASQNSYNCVSNPNDTTGHCYGTIWWGGANGADTRITLNRMSGGDGFVNNEMWLTTLTYWVEAGVKSDDSLNPPDSTIFFWSDNRPNGGGYSNHYGPQLTSGDYSKGNTLVRITRSGTSSWNVSVNDGFSSWTGTSTNNNITIKYIQEGMEVFGTTNVSATTNYFINNRWWDGSTFHYQTNNGVNSEVYLPVSADWSIDPTQSSTGGKWFTCIPGNGC